MSISPKNRQIRVGIQIGGVGSASRIPRLPSGVEEGATGGAGDSRMEDQQEGAGQEHVHQPHSPLQMGLLLANVVPHLDAHVFPVRVETQHCRLLLLLGREHVQTACCSLATPHQPLDDISAGTLRKPLILPGPPGLAPSLAH